MTPWRQRLSQRRTPLGCAGLALLALTWAIWPCLGSDWMTGVLLAPVLIGLATLLPQRLETSDQFLLIIASVCLGGLTFPLGVGCRFLMI